MPERNDSEDAEAPEKNVVDITEMEPASTDKEESLSGNTDKEHTNTTNGADSLHSLPEKSSDQTQGALMRYIDDADYVTYMKEARDEAEKRAPNRAHLKHLLKQTYARRRQEIERMDQQALPMVSSILHDWPCMEFGEFVSTLNLI